MAELTAEQVQAKLEEKRRGLASHQDKADMSSSEVHGTETRQEDADCLRCGESFQRVVTYIDGTRLPGAPAVCPTCLDEEREKEPASPKPSREDHILRLLHEAGVNVRKHGRCTLNAGTEIGVDFDCSSGDTPLRAAQEFADGALAAGSWGFASSLYLCGPTGTGKTHLGAACCRKVLLDPSIPPSSVVFDSADRLIVEIQDTYGTGGTGAALERREHARLWVLDELGAEKATPDALRILLALLNRREGHATLVTSNHTPDELAQRWVSSVEVAEHWARISSRLGAQNYRIVSVKGEDRRFAKAS